ncbi:uncharacterized protein LOC132287541 [Cornus florida]|uniref:uncharacterized protein LOC132287541 n=1 Tax=Cornus florida TaxID=4283 RepID=UPI00289F0851|nr:uncharacterized protein LOC132287541 [Cornus florida]
MWCLHSQSSILPLVLQLKHRQLLETPKLFRLTSYEPTTPLRRQNIPTTIHVSTKAISTSIVLGVTAPAESGGDITVLLQTSAVFLFVYWIANFVVPDIISKDLQFDKTSEDQRADVDNLTEEEKAKKYRRRKTTLQSLSC